MNYKGEELLKSVEDTKTLKDVEMKAEQQTNATKATNKQCCCVLVLLHLRNDLRIDIYR